MDDQGAEQGGQKDEAVKVVGVVHGDFRWLGIATMRRPSLMA